MIIGIWSLQPRLVDGTQLAQELLAPRRISGYLRPRMMMKMNRSNLAQNANLALWSDAAA